MPAFPDTSRVHTAADFNAAMNEVGLPYRLEHAADGWFIMEPLANTADYALRHSTAHFGVVPEAEAVILALRLVADQFWDRP